MVIQLIISNDQSNLLIIREEKHLREMKTNALIDN
jgi:hypothetical protein